MTHTRGLEGDILTHAAEVGCEDIESRRAIVAAMGLAVLPMQLDESLRVERMRHG